MAAPLGNDQVGLDKSRRMEREVLLVLALVQFTSILDFMLIMPLGPQLIRTLMITPAAFGLIVSSYTLSAGVFGLFAATVIDRYGRKSAFLTLYSGFLLGTVCCGLADSYQTLLAARILTGAFGGVLGGMTMAIIGDVFPPERHGAATGTLMSAFSVASVLGLPFGLTLGNNYGWQTPFLVLAVLGSVALYFAAKSLPNLRGHLGVRPQENAFRGIWDTIRSPNHARALLLVVSLMVGGMAVVPYIATYLQWNVGIRESRISLHYIAGGLLTVVSSPAIGWLADRFGRLRIFLIVAPFSAAMMLAITNLPRVPTIVSVFVMGFMMVGMSGRMVPAMALIMGSVEPRRRGQFMSVYSSVQHLASGFGAWLGGVIIVQANEGEQLLHYGRVGLLGAFCTAVSLVLAPMLRPAGDRRPITAGFALGAADQAIADTADPLPALETS